MARLVANAFPVPAFRLIPMRIFACPPLNPTHLSQRHRHRLQRHHKRPPRIRQGDSAVPLVPTGGAVIFGVDDQDHAAGLGGGPQAAAAGGEEELAAEALALHGDMGGEAGQPISRRVAAVIAERRGGQAVGILRTRYPTPEMSRLVANAFPASAFRLRGC